MLNETTNTTLIHEKNLLRNEADSALNENDYDYHSYCVERIETIDGILDKRFLINY